MMNGACNLCGSSSIEKLFSSRKVEAVVRCTGCGLVFRAPSEGGYGELKETYSSDYFREREDYFFKDGVGGGTEDEKEHVKDFRKGLDWIRSYAPPGGKLLDVGCATGSFLVLAKEEGWESHGVEVSDYAASTAKDRSGAKVFNGTLKEARYPDGFFDVITFWDVIEHFPDPLGDLREARRILKAGGLILINTPNEESLIRKTAMLLYKATGGVVVSPINRLYHHFHIYYFSAHSMRLLFEKAGFHVVGEKKKVIPITRGRGSSLAKAVVRGLSMLEKLAHAEYELIFLVRKSD